jgi:hypothetical protein
VNFLQTWAFCALGVLISVLLPIVRNNIPLQGAGVGDAGRRLTRSERIVAILRRVWIVSKPFVFVGLFSVLTAFIVILFLLETLTDWKAAVLAGYAWDSTVQKLKQPTP